MANSLGFKLGRGPIFSGTLNGRKFYWGYWKEEGCSCATPRFESEQEVRIWAKAHGARLVKVQP